MPDPEPDSVHLGPFHECGQYVGSRRTRRGSIPPPESSLLRFDILPRPLPPASVVCSKTRALPPSDPTVLAPVPDVADPASADAMQATVVDGGNSTQSITGLTVTTIDLDFTRWNNPAGSPWEMKEQKLEERRDSINYVLKWLHELPSSQPSQDTIFNSSSLYRRRRHNHEVVDRVDEVFSRSSRAATSKGRPSSVQTTEVSAITALRTWSPSASIIVSSIEERLPESRLVLPLSDPPTTTSDRKSKYNESRHYDQGRPPEASLSEAWEARLPTVSGPQTRGVKNEWAVQHQVHWSLAAAPTSSKKAPKRRNSRLTDEETTSRRPRRKRNRTGVKSQASPSSLCLSISPHPGTSHVSQYLANKTFTSPPRRTRREDSLTANPPGPATIQVDGAHRTNVRRLLLEGDFEDASETCFFLQYTPDQYMSPERHACRGRKEEISHIVTHAADHHGLVRGTDPRNKSRKYLTRCINYDPVVKTKGNCAKCKSIHAWGDADFADHQFGVVLCLRCWRSFTKKGMQEHMAGSLCKYNTEQPKAKKMCILYTTFCSESHPPSRVPTVEGPRRAHRAAMSPTHSDIPTTSHPRQPSITQPNHQQPPGMTSRGAQLHQSLQQQTLGPNTWTTCHSPSTQPLPHSHGTIHSSPALAQTPSPGLPSSPYFQQWPQSTANQPALRPIIGYVPIYEPPPPGITVLSPTMFQAMQQGTSQAASQPLQTSTHLSAPMRQTKSYDHYSQHRLLEQKLQQQASPPNQTATVQPTQYQTRQQPHRSPFYQLHHGQHSYQQLPQEFQQQLLQKQLLKQDPQSAPVQNAFFQQQRSNAPRVQHRQAMQSSFDPRTQTSLETHQEDGEQFEALLAAFQEVTRDRPQSPPPPINHPVSAFSASRTSFSQATPSQGLPTIGEPGAHSPDPNESPLFDIDNMDWSAQLNYVGSRPNLQAPPGPIEPPPRQQIERPRDLALDSRIPSGQQGAVEKDSGFYSIEMKDSDLDEMFDFEGACWGDDIPLDSC
ncbi:hypothetical protein FZEAL_3928 [Fusarium zealandicum]|uniref:Uncharacterized protein n=1 Tax=Fusarium zealandicum TaxID=1053134 RepID=A0A8H4UND8_9HYPO|nr:hypothetical protein FZEAL_3928 [Fusarium zealandicum]